MARILEDLTAIVQVMRGLGFPVVIAARVSKEVRSRGSMRNLLTGADYWQMVHFLVTSLFNEVLSRRRLCRACIGEKECMLEGEQRADGGLDGQV
jgi:hypothetical protein